MMSRKKLKDGRGAAGGFNDKIGNDRKKSDKSETAGCQNREKTRGTHLFLEEQNHHLLLMTLVSLRSHSTYTQSENNTFSHSERIMQRG